MQNRCCAIGCFLNNSSKTHACWLATLMILRNFISLQAFNVYMENSLRFEISRRSMWPKWKYTEVSFTPPKAMWTLLMKFTYLFWLHQVSQNTVRGNREHSYYHVFGILHCSLSFQLLLLLKYQVSKNTPFLIALIT